MARRYDDQEPLMVIQATPFEIIVLNAAIRHYINSFHLQNGEYREALPLLLRFQQRLVEHLPSNKVQQ